MTQNGIKTVKLSTIDVEEPAVFNRISNGGDPSIHRRPSSSSSSSSSSSHESDTDESETTSVNESDISSESAETESTTSSETSVDTMELLGADPLFLVLSQFFMTGEKTGGKNVTEVLQEISDKLSALLVEVKKKKDNKH